VSATRFARASLSVTVALALIFAVGARGAVIYSYEAQPPRAPASSRRAIKPHLAKPLETVPQASARASAPRAPTAPPLSAAPQGAGEQTGGVPSTEGDQLVENGLSSPLCKGAASAVLSRAAQSDCQTSGFVGAAAPTNNYALDVHIDVGALGLSMGGVLSVIQDVFIAPVWNAIVWMVHALVVMLEWCYTLELLGGSSMSAVARSLRQAQASFTEPWLVLVLAVASMLAFYNGLIRRRIAETLGQALLTLAMMAAGLWVIADPLGTVGAVGQWANQASLSTLGAVAQGTPSDAPRTLGDSMRALFSAAIEMPWCYLEFGNVRWCSDPALLEPRLRKAASSLVAAERPRPGCASSAAQPSCASSVNGAASAIGHSEELVREADTNGALFLAFPANEPQRNSVKDAGSLLHVLCQAEDDTKCAGPTAAEAEFRSDGGTFPRMIGVVLIAVGALGMALLFGLIAMHLLAAAVISLFMLLLAPCAVLAPALGDGGRALFSGWATRLLGAVTSKLIFSFLLGALLTMQRTLASLEPLGWWTQWLLISAFWWAVFLKRHQVLALLHNRARAPAAPARRSIARRIEGALETPRAMLRPARWAKGKLLSPAPPDEGLSRPGRSIPAVSVQVTAAAAARGRGKHRSRERGDRGEAGLASAPSPISAPHAGHDARGGEDAVAQRAQLKRLRDAREAALAAGDTRRAAQLSVRTHRVEAEPAGAERSSHEGSWRSGSRAPAGAARSPAGQALAANESSPHVATDDAAHATAVLSGRTGAERRRGATARDSPREQSSFNPTGVPGLAGTERRGNERELDPARDLPTGAGSSAASPPRKSRVMDDARAVMEGRKRQLGYGPEK
jgi:hypothetical protein